MVLPIEIMLRLWKCMDYHLNGMVMSGVADWYGGMDGKGRERGEDGNRVYPDSLSAPSQLSQHRS